ncbi:Mitochondrial intermediate peptidase [Schizosaccharomyces pombe]
MQVRTLLTLGKKKVIGNRQCILSLYRKYSNVQSRKAEDQLLRQIFDDQNIAVNQITKRNGIQGVGLFRNHFLSDKDTGFLRLAETASEKCKAVIEDLLLEDTEDGSIVVSKFDRISNLLCSVIDLFEFVRCAHPDKMVVMKAEEAYSYLFELMNTLNTHQGLYEKLKCSLQQTPTLKDTDPEAYTVGRVFLQDFEKSGVNLESSKRNSFVKKSSESATLGRAFFNNSMNRPQRYLTISKQRLAGSDPYFVRSLFKKDKNFIMIPTVGYEGTQALISVANPDVRKEIYMEGHKGTVEEVELLNSYLRSKAEVAKLVGKNSFADLQLIDKMANAPKHVVEFLENLSLKNSSVLKKILNNLALMKKKELNLNFLPSFDVWDREYYTARYKQSLINQKPSLNPSITNYRRFFSVGTVIQGLSRLFSSLYGLRFVPADISPGEVWHPDVNKVNVYNENDHVMGVIYFDLFARTGKTDGAAHFTIRSSRELDLTSFDDSISLGFDDATNIRVKDNKRYQIPVISLLCNFVRSSGMDPTFLDLWDVKTLFHEMGHAMHSILGHTKYQNLAGTRCATDFVELPSIIMEFFMSNPAVLPLYARYEGTEIPLPVQVLNHHNMVENSSAPLDLQSQICMAMVDQLFHSKVVLDPSFNSIDEVTNVTRKFSGFESAPPAAWYLQFSHLYGYSATYYSYIFDTVLASLIFSKLFAGNPLSREAGEKFRKAILRWGGSRSPWECVAEALEQPILATGGEEAMRRIGSEGIKATSTF